jgi:hypothetical protein
MKQPACACAAALKSILWARKSLSVQRPEFLLYIFIHQILVEREQAVDDAVGRRSMTRFAMVWMNS